MTVCTFLPEFFQVMVASMATVRVAGEKVLSPTETSVPPAGGAGARVGVGVAGGGVV